VYYFNLEEDDCYFIIFKIIEQAVHDFILLDKSANFKDRDDYYTACEFLFNNEYTIMYGDEEKKLEELLELIDIDINWFKNKIIKLKENRVNNLQEKRKSFLKIFLEKALLKNSQLNQ